MSIASGIPVHPCYFATLKIKKLRVWMVRGTIICDTRLVHHLIERVAQHFVDPSTILLVWCNVDSNWEDLLHVFQNMTEYFLWIFANNELMKLSKLCRILPRYATLLSMMWDWSWSNFLDTAEGFCQQTVGNDSHVAVLTTKCVSPN